LSDRHLAGAVLVIATLLATGLAQAQSPGRFSRIMIDTRDLAARGAGLEARQLQACLPDALARAFAGRIVPGDRSAPVLTVRIQAVSLAGGAGTGGVGRGSLRESGHDTDYIEGDAIVGGRVYSMLAVHPASNGIAYDAMVNARHRVDDLCRQFAGWLPWKLGL
jgi:hypothetical protein